MQPLVYFRAEASLITRAYYITRYACHRVTITSRVVKPFFFALPIRLFPAVSLRARTANKKLSYWRNDFTVLQRKKRLGDATQRRASFPYR